MSEADVFACANTIVDFYELVAPNMERGEPGRESQVSLSPAELQRIRDSTTGRTSLPAKAPITGAPSEAPGAAKRAREEPADAAGADGPGEPAKQRRATSTPPASPGAPAKPSEPLPPAVA